MNRRHITEDAIEVFKKLHPFRATAYMVNSLWVIGHNHTKTAKNGMEIDREQADSLLREDMQTNGKYVSRIVTVDLTAHQFSALVIFATNVGIQQFEKAPFIRRLNLGWYDQVPASLIKWSVKGMPKHRVRRSAEADLWRVEDEPEIMEEEDAA